MRHHQDLSLQESGDYALPILYTYSTHQSRVSHNINIMYNNPIMQLTLSNSYNTKQHTIPTTTSYINHDIIPHSRAYRSDKQSHINAPFNNSTTTYPSLAQANRSRSSEGGPLAQAKPVSPRRELEQGSSGLCEISFRQVPSRLGETTPRSKIKTSRLSDRSISRSWPSLY